MIESALLGQPHDFGQNRLGFLGRHRRELLASQNPLGLGDDRSEPGSLRGHDQFLGQGMRVLWRYYIYCTIPAIYSGSTSRLVTYSVNESP